MARLEESEPAVGALLLDKRDAFRSYPDSTAKIENIMSNGVSRLEIDCVDLTVALVGHEDLAAVGPEAR